MAKVQGVSLREIFDATRADEDYLMFVHAVTQMTVETRAEQRRKAEREAR